MLVCNPLHELGQTARIRLFLLHPRAHGPYTAQREAFRREQGRSSVVKNGRKSFPKGRRRPPSHPGSPVLQDRRRRSHLRCRTLRTPFLGDAVSPTQAEQERNRPETISPARSRDGVGDQAPRSRRRLHPLGGSPRPRRRASPDGTAAHCSRRARPGAEAPRSRSRHRGAHPGGITGNCLFVGHSPRAATSAKGAPAGSVTRLRESLSAVGFSLGGTARARCAARLRCITPCPDLASRPSKVGFFDLEEVWRQSTEKQTSALSL
jgi:hypothetical protein